MKLLREIHTMCLESPIADNSANMLHIADIYEVPQKLKQNVKRTVYFFTLTVAFQGGAIHMLPQNWGQWGRLCPLSPVSP